MINSSNPVDSSNIVSSYPYVHASGDTHTFTPIKHLAIIFRENVSYDHCFATYPNATNPSSQPTFVAKNDTPSANGLTPQLIDHDPSSAKPFRLYRSEAVTCDQNHDYKPEQEAYHSGLLDKFIETLGSSDQSCKSEQVMGYFDGNIVTAYATTHKILQWVITRTAQPLVLLLLVHLTWFQARRTPSNVPDEVVNGTVIGDSDGTFYDCSSGHTIAMSGKNIGDLLNDKHITWGWLQGGFKPTSTNTADGGDGKAICGSSV